MSTGLLSIIYLRLLRFKDKPFKEEQGKASLCPPERLHARITVQEFDGVLSDFEQTKEINHLLPKAKESQKIVVISPGSSCF